MTAIDPESAKAIVDAANALGGPVAAGYIAKKAAVDPVLDVVAQQVREWTTKHVTPGVRRVLGLDEAAEIARVAAAEKLAGVPPERLVEPDPAIVASSIDAMRTRHELPELREMLAQLLASSMDGARADAAHPAFAEIIRQLVPDDARLLAHIAERRKVDLGRNSAPERRRSTGVPIGMAERLGLPLVTPEVGLATRAGCQHPNRVLFYLDNLERLGLIEERVSERTASDPQLYEISLTLTFFGSQFVAACLPNPHSAHW